MIKTVFTIFLFFLFQPFLGACTSTADIQRQCAAMTGSFSAEVGCIESMIAQEPALNDDSFVREYVLAGRVLAEKLATGEISETEARRDFAREYNNLVMRQQQYSAYNAIELEAIRPRHTVCRREGASLYCDTY